MVQPRLKAFGLYPTANNINADSQPVTEPGNWTILALSAGVLRIASRPALSNDPRVQVSEPKTTSLFNSIMFATN